VGLGDINSGDVHGHFHTVCGGIFAWGAGLSEKK